MVGPEEIENRFGFHKATIEGAEATTEIHRNLRYAFKAFAKTLDEILPDEYPAMRYKELAFEALEVSSMWSHKGIAQRAPLISE